jgi:hypothetical protein
MPDSQDTHLSFPLPSDVTDTVGVETCVNCHSLCPIGDTDSDGVCSDCREIGQRARALAAPPLPPRPPLTDREPWWNRD